MWHPTRQASLIQASLWFFFFLLFFTPNPPLPFNPTFSFFPLVFLSFLCRNVVGLNRTCSCFYRELARLYPALAVWLHTGSAAFKSAPHHRPPPPLKTAQARAKNHTFSIQKLAFLMTVIKATRALNYVVLLKHGNKCRVFFKADAHAAGWGSVNRYEKDRALVSWPMTSFLSLNFGFTSPFSWFLPPHHPLYGIAVTPWRLIKP